MKRLSLVFLTFIACFVCNLPLNAQEYPFCDYQLPIEKRVADLTHFAA
jgi:hypothetical protein